MTLVQRATGNLVNLYPSSISQNFSICLGYVNWPSKPVEIEVGVAILAAA